MFIIFITYFVIWAQFLGQGLSEQYRRIIFNDAIRDLRPDMKNPVLGILEKWKGDESERSLDGLIGIDERKKLIHNMINKAN